jgi:hypothetical protein
LHSDGGDKKPNKLLLPMTSQRSGLTWKNWLRRGIVRTAVGPIRSVYRGLYLAVAVLGGRFLGGCPDALAVYLCRGVANNEIEPGISDVDFVVVATDRPDGQRQVHRRFRLLSSASAGAIPYHPSFVFTRQRLLDAWNDSLLWRYRLEEGRSRWKLLRGTPVVSELPVPSQRERRLACLGELNYWWVQWCTFLVHEPSFRNDDILRNAICYKAVADVLDVQRLLSGGPTAATREESLATAPSSLAGKLRESKAARHLRSDPSIPEETCGFLLKAIRDAWLSCAADTKPADEPEVSCSLASDETRLRDVRRLPAYQSFAAEAPPFALVRSVGWELDDVLVVIDGGCPPTLAELVRLTTLRDRCFTGTGATATPWLFVRLDGILVPITPRIPRDLHRGVITQATFPEVFLQLGAEELRWTSLCRHALYPWRLSPAPSDACTLKRRQLAIIADGVRHGHVRYPLDAADIEGITIGDGST